MAPKIKLDGLTDIRVRAGQPINLEVEFEGEPAPVATWKINEKPFSGTDHVDLVNKEHQSTIQISSSLRSDSGVYSISVQNEFGVDSAKCQVTVLDVPGTPEGPLSVSKVHKEGCTLAWNPPRKSILNYFCFYSFFKLSFFDFE